MHVLNFCRTLCIPERVDELGNRGFEILHEFKEGYVIPMAGPAAPNHVLYMSKPVHGGIPLSLDDVATVKQFNDIFNGTVSPDFAVDPDTRADVLFENRDDNLKMIADALLRQGNEEVAIWSNNGIGQTVEGEFENRDGVLRYDDGTAFGVVKEGKSQRHYAKGLPYSYQNSAHDHIHIAPGKGDLWLIEKGLAEGHSQPSDWYTFQEARESIREGKRDVPCISFTILDKGSIDKDLLKHSFFFGAASNFPRGANKAGYMRDMVSCYSLIECGINVKDDKTKKRLIEDTKTLYSRILK